LEGLILNFVAPEAQVPETAIIDFLVAISVLPMAAFTTISVLGGSNGLSPWMKDKEEDLENLSQQSLPLPKDEEEIEGQYEEKIENEEDNITSKDEKDDEEGRMIDIPFNLFG
jgi:hypothetical protein